MPPNRVSELRWVRRTAIVESIAPVRKTVEQSRRKIAAVANVFEPLGRLDAAGRFDIPAACRFCPGHGPIIATKTPVVWLSAQLFGAFEASVRREYLEHLSVFFGQVVADEAREVAAEPRAQHEALAERGHE